METLYLHESESRSVMSNSLWPYGSSVFGILQARILEWVPSLGDIPNPGIEPQVSCIAGSFITIWATRKAQEYWSG